MKTPLRHRAALRGRTALRHRTALAAVLLAVPALASCGGFNYQTDQVYTPAAGVDDRSGSVDVLNAVLVSSEDGVATFAGSLVNNSLTTADTFTGITGAGVTATVPRTVIHPGDLVNFATEGQVVVKGDRVVPGNFVDLTFSFANGDAASIHVPVYERSGDYADVPAPAEPTESTKSTAAKAEHTKEKQSEEKQATGDETADADTPAAN